MNTPGQFDSLLVEWTYGLGRTMARVERLLTEFRFTSIAPAFGLPVGGRHGDRPAGAAVSQ